MSVTVDELDNAIRVSVVATCPHCGDGLRLVSGTAALTREWKAILRCQKCKIEQVLLARLVPVAGTYERDERAPLVTCGTEQGYRVHRANAEPQCPACLAAHADEARDYYKRNRGAILARDVELRRRQKAGT